MVACRGKEIAVGELLFMLLRHGVCTAYLRPFKIASLPFSFLLMLAGCTAQNISPLAATAQPSSLGGQSQQAPKASGQALPLPYESLLACFQRQSVSGAPSLMALATESFSPGASEPFSGTHTGSQFSERRIDVDPDLVTRYTEAVLTAPAMSGSSPATLNHHLMAADLACIETQQKAAHNRLAVQAPQNAAPLSERTSLQNFTQANRQLKRDITAIYNSIAKFLSITDQESIPEHIGRRFHARTLRLIDNTGWITQQQRQQTALR